MVAFSVAKTREVKDIIYLASYELQRSTIMFLSMLNEIFSSINTILRSFWKRILGLLTTLVWWSINIFLLCNKGPNTVLWNLDTEESWISWWCCVETETYRMSIANRDHSHFSRISVMLQQTIGCSLIPKSPSAWRKVSIRCLEIERLWVPVSSKHTSMEMHHHPFALLSIFLTQSWGRIHQPTGNFSPLFSWGYLDIDTLRKNLRSRKSCFSSPSHLPIVRSTDLSICQQQASTFVETQLTSHQFGAFSSLAISASFSFRDCSELVAGSNLAALMLISDSRGMMFRELSSCELGVRCSGKWM